ncbi:hypothetical protein TTHERM_00812870 (macronuclear) [Tetrahymena thermophila SB210]|uniref:Tetratricopeptide repeat protein n=1 Tax=Tetrahymena thermophila (strain SB210) TaxID=312017 RepID=Q22SU4_TETTS|nr:hypothetical protein TTHERM_00812870 [Tetrahymena thermophila SB210]EAR88370.2 hypothetical protein TTHERM_00812870 [Tetrahymena thermophila SB210]|eukprot:XP_001008615.2 hypothetical protein TTHERM_00812870 [Tetrahymena thermophila SB210]
MIFMRKNLQQQFQNDTKNLTDSAGKSMAISKLQLNSEPKMSLSSMIMQSQNSINENTCFDQQNLHYDTQSKINYISDGTDYNRQVPNFINSEQKRNYERNQELEENIHRQANQTRYQSLFKRFLQRERFDTTLSQSIQNSVFKSQQKDAEMNRIKEFLIASAQQDQQESNQTTLTNQNNLQNNMTLDEKIIKISEKIEKEFEKDLQTIQKSSQQLLQQQINTSSSASPSVYARSQKNTNRRYQLEYNSQMHSSKQSPKNTNYSQFESNEYPVHSNITRQSINYQNEAISTATAAATVDDDNKYYSSIVKSDNETSQINIQKLQKENEKQIQQLKTSKDEDRIFNEILGRNSQYFAEYEQNKVNKIKQINQSHDRSLQEDTNFLNKNTTNLEFSITKNNETDFLTKRNSRPNSNRLLQRSDLQVFAEILENSYANQNKVGIVNSTSVSNTNTHVNCKDSIGQTTTLTNNHIPSNFQLEKCTGRSSPEHSLCKRKNSRSSKNSQFQTRENTNCMVSRQLSPENYQIEQYKGSHSNSQMSSQQEESNMSYANISKNEVNCLKQILMHDLNYNNINGSSINQYDNKRPQQNKDYNQTDNVSDVSSVEQANQRAFDGYHDSSDNNGIQINQTIQEVKQEEEEDTIGNLEKEESLQIQKNGNYSFYQNNIIQPSFRISDSSNKKSVITPLKQQTKSLSYYQKGESSDQEYDYEQIKVDNKDSRKIHNSDLQDSSRETRLKKIQNTDYESSCNDISALSQLPKTQQSNKSHSHKKINSNQKREKPFLTLEDEDDENQNDKQESKNQLYNQRQTKSFSQDNKENINSFQEKNSNQRIKENARQLSIEKNFKGEQNDESQSQCVNQNNNLNNSNYEVTNQNNFQDQNQEYQKYCYYQSQLENDQFYYPCSHQRSNQCYQFNFNQKSTNLLSLQDQNNQDQENLISQNNQPAQLQKENSQINFHHHTRNKSDLNSHYTQTKSNYQKKRDYPSVRLSWNNISTQKERQNEGNLSQDFYCYNDIVTENKQDQKEHIQNILKEKMQNRLDYYQNGNLQKLIIEKEKLALNLIEQNNLREAIRILDSFLKENSDDIPTYDPHKVYMYYLLIECLYNSQRLIDLQRVCSLFYNQYTNFKFEDSKILTYCFKIFNYYASSILEEESQQEKCIVILQKLLDLTRTHKNGLLDVESKKQQIQSQEEIEIVMKLVQCFMKIKDYKQAIKYLNEIIPILKNHQNTKILLAFKRKAQCFTLLHQESEAEKQLDEALKYSELQFKIHRKEDFVTLSEIYEESAKIKSKQNNFVESVEKLQHAIKILKNLDDYKYQERIALLLAEQGKFLVKIEEYQAASSNFLDAYNIIIQLKGKYCQQATDCLLSIAKIYYKQKKLNSSVEIYEAVLQMYQKMSVKIYDIKHLKIILIILELCLEAQINEKYELYENKLKEIINEYKNKESCFIIANEVGNLLRKFKLIDGSIYYYQKALQEIYPELKLQDSTKNQLILVMCNLASSLSVSQKFVQSLQMYEQALQECIRFHGKESHQTKQIIESIQNLRSIIQKISQK